MLIELFCLICDTFFLALDISTDGIWCYVVLWVVPHSSSLVVKWSNLKNRLQSECPSCSVSYLLYEQPPTYPPSSPVYLLKFFCLDRRGLLHGKRLFFAWLLVCFVTGEKGRGKSEFLHALMWLCFPLDVTQVLCELELTIQRVKVTTTPDGSVLDLFFITDHRLRIFSPLLCCSFITRTSWTWHGHLCYNIFIHGNWLSLPWFSLLNKYSISGQTQIFFSLQYAHSQFSLQ